MDVGLALRQARERRGLSLQQLSKTTKISIRVLDAIEASDGAKLPAPVFTRSFVRTYAAEVGLDPDDTWRSYLEQFEPPAEPGAPEAPTEPQPATAPRDVPRYTGARVLHGRFGTAIVLILTGLAVAALAARNYRQAHPSATSQAQTVHVSAAGFVPPAQEPQAVATSGTAQALAADLHVTIAPTGPCWVQASVNGERVFATLLGSGDRRMVDAPAEIILRVGDAGTFAFLINGKPAKVTGAAGQAVTVRITKDNYSQFLLRS